MLSERTKNMFVGLTIIGAIVVLLYGVLILGKTQNITESTYRIIILTNDAGGINAGGKVRVMGVIVGQVASVYLDHDPKTHEMEAFILADIQTKTDIPERSKVVVSAGAVGSSASVNITYKGDAGSPIPKNGSGILYAGPAEASLIPQSALDNIQTITDVVVKMQLPVLTQKLSALTDQLTSDAKNLDQLLVYTTPEEAATNPSQSRANISTVIIRADRTLASLQALLTDPALQGQVREIVSNLADATRSLHATLASIDATVRNAGGAFTSAANEIGGAATRASAVLDSTQMQIAKISQNLADTLTQIEKTVRQINEGAGTTGKLINDPRLYEGLVDLTKSLHETLDRLDFLLDKWKDEGINLKLK